MTDFEISAAKFLNSWIDSMEENLSCCYKCQLEQSCEKSMKYGEYLNCTSFDPVITNGYKFRKMSDEKIAEFITENNFSREEWLNWLKQEVGE